MDYLPGQYGMHYERIGLNDYHYDSLGLTGHRPYYAFAGNQLATGEQGSNGNYYWMQQQHSGRHLVGQKQYELTNHLGNVQVTVSDLPYKHGNDTMTHISPALKAVYDYYPFGSPMPGRTIMDTARKCVDMTRLDRVWKAWEMTQTEIYALSLINYHLDGEGEVFIDDNGAVEIAVEHAVFYMELQDSLNNGGEMVLHVDWLKEFSEKGFLLTLQGMDATGEMRVFYQKHYEKPEDAVYLNIADSFTNVSVGIQGNVHFRLDNICYTGGSWVNEEVLVRVCDDGGDRYRFGFNGMLKDNEWAGMGTHLDFGARIYDSRGGRFLSLDPLMNKFPSESNYIFAGNSPIMLLDKKGEKKTVYTKIIDETTGKTYVRTDVSSGLLKRVSTHVGTAWYDDKSDFYRQNDWYDYTITNTLVIHKDGTATYSSTSEPTKLRTSTFPFMGEQYAKLKVGESFPKVKDKGMFDGFYLYSKDADGSDSKFNPTGGPGSKAVDAGPIMQAMRRINTIVGTPPSGIIRAIKHLNKGAQVTTSNLSEGNGLIEIKRRNEKSGPCKDCKQIYKNGEQVTDSAEKKEVLQNNKDSIRAGDHK